MHEIHDLADRIVEETASALPVEATLLGVTGHDHEWSDYSPAGGEALREMYLHHLAAVRSLSSAGDPWDRLAVEVIVEDLERGAEFYDEDHLCNLNSIDSPLQNTREVFDHMDTGSAAGWEAIADRLEGLPGALADYRAGLDEGRRRGMAVARRQVEAGIRQCRTAAGDGSSFASMPAGLEHSGVGGAALAARVAAGAGAARAAFGELAGYLETTYLPDAPVADAVGRRRYERAVRRFLGTTIDLAATYEWGWTEVARLRGAMEQVGAEILPGAPLPGVLDALANDPARAARPGEFIELMAERQQIALDHLQGTHFDVPEPIRTVEVKAAPPGGPLGAYYVGPSEDFARPGCVWFSLGDAAMVPLFDQVSTAYHEGFPGHHLQVGMQVVGAAPVTRYQRMLVWSPGSGEGWALYAEDLMEELGYLEKPEYRFGKYAAEMLRACRVVIDIGSHLELPIPGGQPFHPGEPWTFGTGVEMLVDYAAQSRPVAESEMTRYLGWPGQAISYKVGQQAIRDLRAGEQATLGSGFDLKSFHARLLEVGAVGLDTLRAWMRRTT